MNLDLSFNTDQAARLAHAWRLFSKGVNEQSMRNNSAALFLQQSDDVSLLLHSLIASFLQNISAQNCVFE